MSIDLYVLAPERSEKVAQRFLETWLTGSVESASDYEFPQYSNEPSARYRSAAALIAKLIEQPHEPHAIYWQNPTDERVANGMLFFTSDGGMIVGLTIRTDDQAEAADFLLRLAATVNGQFGYMAFEQPPPDTIREFMAAVERSPWPRIVNGSVRD